MSGKLYLVATPIGNLKDISQRAIEILNEVDIIACEDTRHSQKLLNHLGIKKKLVSYHEHNEKVRAEELVNNLLEEKSVAVVSDAGTPGISDPGYRIVERAILSKVEIVPVPGPSAFVAALTASGLPTDSVFFGGFLPAKKGDRRARLTEVADIPATLVFYETPHRLASALKDCLDVLGDRRAVIARELTKVYEESIRGDLSELSFAIQGKPLKGEIVLLIERGHREQGRAGNKSLVERVAELESAGNDRKSALKQAAREFGLSRSQAYRELQIMKRS
jgi:16S rRNA (cytidine1402-2'-O)-methyltransferase